MAKLWFRCQDSWFHTLTKRVKRCITHTMRLSEKSKVVSKIGSKQIQNCLREQRKLAGFGFYRVDTGVKAPTCWSGLVRFKIPIAYKGECIQVFLSACPYIWQKGNWGMGRRAWNLWAVKDQRCIGLHHNSLCVWLSELRHVWNCLKPQWYFVSQKSV